MSVQLMFVALVVGAVSHAVRTPINYNRAGVLAWNVGPPTPFWFPPNENGSMMVFECARFCHPDDTYWPPDPVSGDLIPFSNQSYFRIRDMASGVVVGNVQGSQGYAYGSAVVDPMSGVAWVFGSPTDLCHKTPRTHADNFVRAWWSTDLQHWHTSHHPALQPPLLDAFPFNTDVTPVSLSNTMLASIGLPAHVNFVMVLEHGRVALHVGPSRNLTTGWQAVSGDNVIHTSKAFGACPSIHYALTTNEFYIVSGGVEIVLTRTNDFVTWENAVVVLVAADLDKDARISSYMGMSEQAAGTHVGADKVAAATLRRIIANPHCWEFDVNDADFCCADDSGAPDGRAYLFYSPSSQGHAPRANCSTLKLTATDFNAVATADVSLTTLLQSYF